MTDEQFSAALRAFSRRRRFRPFVVEFTNGNRVRIKNREGVAPFAGNVWLFVEPQGSHVVFASSSVCRLLDTPEAES